MSKNKKTKKNIEEKPIGKIIDNFETVNLPYFTCKNNTGDKLGGVITNLTTEQKNLFNVEGKE